MYIGRDTFCLLYDIPGTFNADKMNYPYEFIIDVVNNIEQYYVWLNNNVGEQPRWDIDDKRFIVDDGTIKVKFLFKYREDLTAFKLKWSGIK